MTEVVVVDPSVLPRFLAVVVLVTIVPGPDNAYIAAVAVDRGVRAGLLSATGMAVGMVVHVTAAALGLGVLLRSSPTALDAVRLGGASYLGWLAVTTLRPSRLSGRGTAAAPAADGQLMRRAVLTNLLNPKVVLFFAAFLPQFVRPGAGPTTLQLLTLGLVFLVVGLVIDCAVGWSAGRLGTALSPRTAAATTLSVVAALTFAALAVLLVIEAVRSSPAP